MKKFPLILAISVTLLLSACAKPPAQTSTPAAGTPAASATATPEPSGDALEKLDIQALGGGACGAPSYIAYEKGFFKDHGLDVTLVSGTFETNKAGLANGNYTIANGDFQFFPSANEGLDIKIIGGLHEGCIKLVVPPGSPIKTIADLAGKNIGVDEMGGTPMAVTSVLLANNGIDPSSGVTWVPYPLDQLTVAVDKGEIDAYAAWDPYATIAEQKDNYTVLSDIATDPLFADRSCCFLYASGKQLKDNPQRVKKVYDAYLDAQKWISENPDEAAQILSDKKYVPTEDVSFLAELLKSYNYDAHHSDNASKAKEDAVYFTNELKKTGYLPNDLDSTAFIDNLFFDVNTIQ
ncbi:hypothetical protein AGMMS49975_17060 [Clostridia bacterium]|nr:hypothetical protein AGMMS49975_17060 [Clostridia bacterium]